MEKVSEIQVKFYHSIFTLKILKDLQISLYRFSSKIKETLRQTHHSTNEQDISAKYTNKLINKNGHFRLHLANDKTVEHQSAVNPNLTLKRMENWRKHLLTINFSSSELTVGITVQGKLEVTEFPEKVVPHSTEESRKD